MPSKRFGARNAQRRRPHYVDLIALRVVETYIEHAAIWQTAMLKSQPRRENLYCTLPGCHRSIDAVSIAAASCCVSATTVSVAGCKRTRSPAQPDAQKLCYNLGDTPFALWLPAASTLSDARGTRKSVPLILPLAASKKLLNLAVGAVTPGSCWRAAAVANLPVLLLTLSYFNNDDRASTNSKGRFAIYDLLLEGWQQ